MPTSPLAETTWPTNRIACSDASPCASRSPLPSHSPGPLHPCLSARQTTKPPLHGACKADSKISVQGQDAVSNMPHQPSPPAADVSQRQTEPPPPHLYGELST